jgi:hypothetical protein
MVAAANPAFVSINKSSRRSIAKLCKARFRRSPR